MKRLTIGLFVLVCGMAQDARITEVRTLLVEASALLPKVEPRWRTSVSYNIMGTQVRLGDFQTVLAAINQMETTGEKADRIAMVTSSLARAGDWKSAIALVDEVLPRPTRASGYSGIVRILEEKHDLNALHQVVDRLRDLRSASDLSNDQFIGALRGLCEEQFRIGDTPAALRTLAEFSDKELYRENVYQNLVFGLISSGHKRAAMVVIERLQSSVTREKNPDGKESLLGTLATAQAMLGELAAARDTASQLPEGMIRESTLSQIVARQAAAGDPAGARRVAEASGGAALQASAAAYAMAGDYSKAMAVLNEIKNPGERTSGLQQVATMLASKSDPAAADFAERAVEAIRQAHLEGTPLKDHVWRSVAFSRAVAGNFTGAIEAAKQTGEFRAQTLKDIAEMMVEAGKKQGALALARAQDDAYPRAECLLGVINGLLTLMEKR